MDISKWAFRNRNLIYFLIAVLLLGGAYSCYQMSKLEDPEIKVKLAMVVTTYPGASAHQVELEVTDVLEKNIRTMGNIDNIESYSYNDLSLIQIELLSTVPDDDVEQCWDMLRRKVSDARALLPEGATTPIVKDDFGNVYGMFYALTGDGLSDRELSDYAELVKREVNELEGVDRVELYGKRSECINISLLQDRMANLGVKPAEVLATLNGQNKTTYTGYYENGENRIRVTVNDKFKTVEDIGKMLIQGHDDDQLRLSDIARIEKAYENPTRNEMFYDHERALGILIAASSGSDIIKVGHAVESKLEELKAERLPAGVECHKIFYQPERVGSSLGTFVINLIESVIIVVLILMIAMGFKSVLPQKDLLQVVPDGGSGLVQIAQEQILLEHRHIVHAPLGELGVRAAPLHETAQALHDGSAVVQVFLRQAGDLGDVVLQFAEDAGAQMDGEGIENVGVFVDLHRADLDDLTPEGLLHPMIVERIRLVADVPFQIK